MPKCDEILKEVLERNELTEPDGYPLYTYRLTTNELDLLRVELTSRFEIAGRLKTQSEFAAFCMFGAEWFRRHYDSGVWAWHTIFDGLGVDRDRQFGSLVQQRMEYTANGLSWWELDLIQTHLSNRYLDTLICQGGFPINTLKKSGAGISRYLKTCLREHERFPTEPMAEITQRYVHYIPTTLDNADVRGLVGELVRSIAVLRKQSDDATSRGAGRFEYLEENHPGWERELPLRVEDPDAKELLISLLDVAKSQPFSHRKISISTTLNLGQKEGTVTRHLQFPSSMSEEDFRYLLGFDKEEHLLPRMTGFLQAGEMRVPCVNIARNHDGSKFRLNKLDTTSLSGGEAYQKTSLVLAVGGQEVKQVDLAGGEELPDSPWVFVDEEAGNLIGVGSVKPRDEKVIVAIPDGCDVSLSPDDSSMEKLPVQVAGRNVLRLAGAATFYMEDISFRVVTKSEEEEAFLYELRGNRRKLGTGGSDIWIGMPSVYEVPIAEEGVPTEISPNSVEWRVATGGDWQVGSIDCLGDVVIRVQDGNETRFFTKATVLPSGFTYQIVPGSNAGEGRIKLRGLGAINIDVERTELAVLKAERTEEGQVIDVEVPGERPNLLNFRFRFQNGNNCLISFVCPTESVNIVNAAGEALPKSQGIPVDEMDGLNLQIVRPSGSLPLIYDREYGQLIDAARETKVEGLLELPLSYVKDHAAGILALSDEPDSSVGYEIKFKNSARAVPAWKASRFGRALLRRNGHERKYEDDNITEFYIADDLISDLEGQELTVSVTPLGLPKAQMASDSVSFEEPGSWFVNHSDYPAGYYLAVARQDGGDCLRPIRFVVKPKDLNEMVEIEPANETLFDHVLNIRDTDERQQAWNEFFAELALDHSHPGWQRVTDMLEASYELPITTYETVAALTRNPDAVARYGILDPGNARLWQRLERLPFLWSLVPLSSWIKTARKTLEFVQGTLEKAGFEKSQIDAAIKAKSDAFVREAPNRIPSMACVSVCLWSAGFEVDFKLLRMAGPNQIEGLTMEDRIREQARLIDQKTKFDTRNTWPNFKVDYCNEVRDIFYSAAGLAITDTHRNQWAVMNGPAIAAVHAVYDFDVSPDQVRQFKRLRALDPDWYDKANAVATFVLMQKRLQEEPDAFKKETNA